MSRPKPGIGLALSGGGFRAAFFHVGVLRALGRLELLSQVRILSCVSGGSIAGAVYYLTLIEALLADKTIKPQEELALLDKTLTPEDYRECVVKCEAVLARMARANVRAAVFRNPWKNATMFLTPRYSRTDRAGDLLDQYLREELNLESGHRHWRIANQLQMRSLHIVHPSLPHLVLNATTMNTGHTWRFDTDGMGELLADNPAGRRRVDKNDLLSWGEYNSLPAQQDMPYAIAVAGSAAFPGLFRPLPISYLYDRRVDVMDGGAQDNQGIQSLVGTQPPSTESIVLDRIFVSDGAAQMLDEMTKRRSAVDIGRVVGIQGDRIREEQLLAAFDREAAGETPVALFDLRHRLGYRKISPSGEITTVGAAEEGASSAALNSRLAEIRTDLDAFGTLELELLQRRGYEVAHDVLQVPSDLAPLALPGRTQRRLHIASKQTLKPFRLFYVAWLLELSLAAAALIGGAWSLRFLGPEPSWRLALRLALFVAFLLAPAAISRFLLWSLPWSWPRLFKWLAAGGIYAGLLLAARRYGPDIDSWFDATWTQDQSLAIAAVLLGAPPLLPCVIWFFLWLQGLAWRGLARLPAG